MHILLTIAFTICFLMTSLAQAAEPGTRQLRRPPMQQQRGTVQQLQITPEYLNQKILSLTQKVQALQTQLNSLRSVVKVTPNGATLQAEYLTIKGIKHLALVSSKKMQLTAADDLGLASGKNLSLTGDRNVTVTGEKDVTVEGDSKIKLKAPQIKFNDGNKPIALKDSPVAGGKVISGSTSVFAK